MPSWLRFVCAHPSLIFIQKTGRTEEKAYQWLRDPVCWYCCFFPSAGSRMGVDIFTSSRCPLCTELSVTLGRASGRGVCSGQTLGPCGVEGKVLVCVLRVLGGHCQCAGVCAHVCDRGGGVDGGAVSCVSECEDSMVLLSADTRGSLPPPQKSPANRELATLASQQARHLG